MKHSNKIIKAKIIFYQVNEVLLLVLRVMIIILDFYYVWVKVIDQVILLLNTCTSLLIDQLVIVKVLSVNLKNND